MRRERLRFPDYFMKFSSRMLRHVGKNFFIPTYFVTLVDKKDQLFSVIIRMGLSYSGLITLLRLGKS